MEINGFVILVVLGIMMGWFFNIYLKRPQFIGYKGQLKFDRSKIMGYCLSDEIDEKNISKNKYGIAFLLSTNQKIFWIFKDKEERNVVLNKIEDKYIKVVMIGL